MKLTKEQLELCNDIYEASNVDIEEALTNNSFKDYEELIDYLQDNGYFDIEIIYYNKAIEYLKENDSSLQSSLEIAQELGYTVGSLNSEVLASLLASQNAREELEKYRDELEAILESHEE